MFMTSLSLVFGPGQSYDRPLTNNSLLFFTGRFNSIGLGSSEFTIYRLILPRSARNSNGKVTMADSDSNSSGADYAEIIVVRHGETARNADGRIQKGMLEVLRLAMESGA